MVIGAAGHEAGTSPPPIIGATRDQAQVGLPVSLRRPIKKWGQERSMSGRRGGSGKPGEDRGGPAGGPPGGHPTERNPLHR